MSDRTHLMNVTRGHLGAYAPTGRWPNPAKYRAACAEMARLNLLAAVEKYASEMTDDGRADIARVLLIGGDAA